MKMKGHIIKYLLCLISLQFVVTGCASSGESELQASDAEPVSISVTQELLVIPSIDYGLLDRWNYALQEEYPTILSVEQVVKGQVLQIPVLFPISLNSQANEIFYDIRIQSPDGSLYFSAEDFILSSQALEEGLYYLGETLVNLVFEPEDTLGEYEIHVRAYDSSESFVQRGQAVVSLVEQVEGKGFKGDEEFSKWMTFYYTNPEPERIVQAYKYYIESSLSENDNAFAPVIGFFREVLIHNPPLLDELLEEYPSLHTREKVFFGFLFYYIDEDWADEYLQGLTESEDRHLYKEVFRDSNLGLLDRPIESPSQLDFLWGSFFASGKYQPIWELVDSMDHPNVFISQAAVWSVGSNKDQHDLVLQYLNYMLEEEELHPTVQDPLRDLLQR